MIRRRHVIYVQGYDPRGYVEYYRMFRGEYRKFLDLYGLKGTLEREADRPGRRSSSWSVETRGSNWRVDTTYEFLRWEDIIREDFRRPAWKIVPAAFLVVLRALFDGVLFRIFRAHWRFGLFIAYPFVVLGLWLLIGAAFAAGAFWIVSSAAPAGVAGAGAAAVGIATLLFALKLTEPVTYILYLFQDMVSTGQYARGRRPDWEARLDLFAAAVVEAARTPGLDEIVVVGHSSGSFLAVDVMARALALDPALGRRGPCVALLTVGANLPIVGFQPEAGWFRARLARVAADPSIDWVDYQSRRDVMNFFPFDPVTGHRLALERSNIRVVPVQFRNIVGRKRFAWLCWHFFDLHFQFLRANERADAYDYFMIVAGPFSLASRAALPEAAKAAVCAEQPAAGDAWQALAAIHAQAGCGSRAAARM